MKAYSYIRFSRPEQSNGDSLRRQLEASQSYCQKHGLVLDQNLNMQDEGLSAFHGVHKTKGALGLFLALVQQGKIPKGSVLIVENLDRLSREQVLDALNQFTNIIKAGIRIVTLQDNMEYDEKSIHSNWSQLIISITYMARAHDESLRKSQRLKSAWIEKRMKAVKEKKSMTRMLPAWMKYDEEKSTLLLIPEVCHAIETIYKMKLEGMGGAKIANILNQREDIWKPPVNKRNKTGGWRLSYITKLLSNNRALIGEYQPHVIKDQKRVPSGEPISDYYPKAIDKDLFYAVQKQIKDNRDLNKGHGGGRNEKASNLFVHVVKCGFCGSPMHFVNKGSGLRYLVCDRSNRKLGCTAKPVNYDEFEKLFFKEFDELDLSEITEDADAVQKEVNSLQQTIDAKSMEGQQVEKKISNLSNAIAESDSIEMQKLFKEKIQKLFDQKENIQSVLDSCSVRKKEIGQTMKQMKKNLSAATEVYDLFSKASDDSQKLEYRIKLRSQIKRIVEQIDLYPLDRKYKEMEKTGEVGVYIESKSKWIQRFRIKFRGSRNKRVVFLQSTVELY